MNSSNTYSVQQVLSAFDTIQEKKGLAQLLEKVIENIFGGDIDSKNKEEFDVFHRKFNSLYFSMKDKFSETYRSTGERYFEHLRAVVENVLELPNSNTDKVLIALAHDSIEDTDITFIGLSEFYSPKIALGVQAISKEDWKNFVSEEWKDEGKENIPQEIIEEAKSIRNERYFGHMKSFASMRKYMGELADDKGIELSDEQLDILTQDTLDVKFADRIHNLSTQWDPNNLKTVRRKLQETKEYFLSIANETNKVAFDRLQELILVLEMRLHGAALKAKKIISSS